MSRGIKNNNPLNIRKSSVEFKGEVTPSRDKSFKEFRTLAYGYRAAFKVLRTYYEKYNLGTAALRVSSGNRNQYRTGVGWGYGSRVVV